MTGYSLGIFDRVRLDKAATDAGFDVRREPLSDSLQFGSTSSPLRIALAMHDFKPVVAVSMANVLAELALPPAALALLPDDMVGSFVVPNFGELQVTLARAYELANALPTMLLHKWRAKVTALSATERDAAVRERVGQDLFRQGLLALWNGRCAVTGLETPALLRASHAKPWRLASDEERLDVYNGLLLAAHLDAAFDAGLISFTPSGELLVSDRLAHEDRNLLGLRGWPPIQLRPEHQPYMKFHREVVFSGVHRA